MNTLSNKSETRKWIGLLIILMTVTVVFSILACMILVATPAVIDTVMLRSLADQLGTKPSKAALVAHVTELLENHKGSSRIEVHQVLNEIGGFTYQELFRYRNGESQEQIYWTMAQLPLGVKIWTSWSLRYDSDGALILVLPGSW